MPDLWVLIIDDGRGESFYDPLFEENADRRRSAGLEGRLRRYGVIRQTPHAGRAGVLDALNDGVPIDLILMDHVLSDGGHPPQEVRASVKLMGWIRGEYARWPATLPPCVLWSAEYSPGLAYAFRLAGGQHAFPHTRPLAEVADALWAVARDGSSWEHARNGPQLKLTSFDEALLPYLEADWPNHRIAEERSVVEGELVTAETIGQRRRNLVGRVNADRRARDLPEIVGTNPSVSLTDYVRDRGHIWVPLALRDDVA